MLTGPTSHHFVSQRLQMHYADWGNPEAPPLVLLHGGRDHCRSWDWTAEDLRHDWHVIAPDLRGHGDSAWSPDGAYSMSSYIYDLAQLIHQLRLAPVTLVAHSLGGNIALRYAGIYPENVRRIVAIEGLGPAPEIMVEREARPAAEHLRNWIGEKRRGSGRPPRRYPDLEQAHERMKTENPHLSDEQARHLTLHGVHQNEDGTWSWKFDNYVRFMDPVDLPQSQVEALWVAIDCPTLLLYGADSWASNPAEDGRARHFRDARVELYDNAGHWLHHDRFERFIADLKAFL